MSNKQRSRWQTLDEARKDLDAAQAEIDRLRIVLAAAEGARERLALELSETLQASVVCDG